MSRYTLIRHDPTVRFRRAWEDLGAVAGKLLDVVILDELEYQVLEQIGRLGEARAEFEVALLNGDTDDMTALAEGRLEGLGARGEELGRWVADATRVASALEGLHGEELAREHAARVVSLSCAWAPITLTKWRERIPGAPHKDTISGALRRLARRGLIFVGEAEDRTDRTGYYLVNSRAINAAVASESRDATSPPMPARVGRIRLAQATSQNPDVEIPEAGNGFPKSRTGSSQNPDGVVLKPGRGSTKTRTSIDALETADTEETGGDQIAPLLRSRLSPTSGRLQQCGLPRGLAAVDLVHLNGVDASYDGAASAARLWARGELDALVLSGGPGRGKTTIAAAACWQLMADVGPAIWLEHHRVRRLIDDADFKSKERGELVTAMNSQTALVLDDLDGLSTARRPPGRAERTLAGAIAERLQRGIPVLITTDLDKGGLQAALGEKSYGRLAARAEFVALHGPNLNKLAVRAA